jgi:hypothetical protein
MSDKTAILDKLKEYEKTGHYDGAVGDIYALIHHIAALEEDRKELRAQDLSGPSISESIRDRNNARDTESRLKEAESRIRALERDIRWQEWARSMSRYMF